MKTHNAYFGTRYFRGVLVGAAILSLTAGPVAAQTFSSGSDGSDGAFNPSCAPTPCTVTVPLDADGVFNYTTINIPNGVTVKFTRNAANTPAILLATGDVTISGTLDVSGGDAASFGRPGQGGPGGFDGGAGADGVTTVSAGFGVGPGGGGPGTDANGAGGGGGYGTAGATASVAPTGTHGAGGPAYGSPALRPILGGSGGGGGGGSLGSQVGGGGGSGGGAIVIASSTSVSINVDFVQGAFNITANAGTGSNGSRGGGGGSGGAIRVVAETITGIGKLEARGGAGDNPFGAAGANGRIRLEATNLTYNGETTPLATAGAPQPVFPGTGQPTLTIASVGGIAAPASPSGSLLVAPDIVLPTGTTNPVAATLTASNIPLGTAILVTATPQSGAPASATSGGLTGTLASSTATASLTIDLNQTSVLTATATFPLVASAGGGPIFAEGEEVKWVKVSATYGGGSTVTYLTASGKEVRMR